MPPSRPRADKPKQRRVSVVWLAQHGAPAEETRAVMEPSGDGAVGAAVGAQAAGNPVTVRAHNIVGGPTLHARPRVRHCGETNRHVSLSRTSEAMRLVVGVGRDGCPLTVACGGLRWQWDDERQLQVRSAIETFQQSKLFPDYLYMVLLKKNICRDPKDARRIVDMLLTGELGFKFRIMKGVWKSGEVTFEFELPKPGRGDVAERLNTAGRVEKLHEMPKPRPGEKQASGAYVIRRDDPKGLRAECKDQGASTVITTVSALHPSPRLTGRWRTGRVWV